ncbi:MULTISPECIES: hypothetical protein [Paenibacillus]|uniref:Lipoprotein n=1 Tax=Paenibacillus odorifer TaxID=189426 RepID=A0AB36J9B5_9BACL|nr:hypothetical protein [Paenibacillus odorifer]MEC0131554.1 hypothetical protein [Paenibacillus odorifer]MEC0220293.1 hypothetical protein [Paenibacillus odorifer]OME11434.1 hypothetical protein BSK47_29080 [Paenibacillus odorifer]
MSRKIILAVLSLMFMFSTSACDSLNPNNKLVETLKDTYFEDNQVSGFISTLTNQIDISSTYYTFEINRFYGNLIQINKEKLKILVLTKISSMTQEKNLSRALIEEKDTISLAKELEIQLDEDFKKNIINSLEKHLKDESKQTPNTDQTTININQQYKLQIHFNFLSIINSMNMKISPSIKELIKSNLTMVERSLTLSEQKSIKAIYYTYFVKKWLSIPVDEQTVTEKLDLLRLADHSYLFLPIKDQMELKINGSDNGDISSTRLANEILVDLYGIKNLKNKEGTLKYISDYIEKMNNLTYESSTIYINDMYEVVYLSGVMGYHEFRKLKR